MGSLVNGGWIKLYRELISKSIWQLSSPEHKTILITILLLANHEETTWEWKGQQHSCKPGQLITSLESLAAESGAGVSIKNVRTALKRFEKLGFLANESAKTGRLITVVNWAKYQGQFEEGGKEGGKQVAKTWQTGGKQVATNKNNKNDKNVRREEGKYIGRTRPTFIQPTLEEVRSYCEERENDVDPERFVDYYEARGWELTKCRKMKDWKAAVRTWERNDKKWNKEKHPDNHPDQRKEYEDIVDWGM